MKKLKIFINNYHYAKISSLQDFVASAFLFILLFVPSLFYSAIIRCKNFLYAINILKEKKVEPYVICIGNLTTGGVGKTPIVCEIANYCSNVLNKKTAIISRGYGAKLDNKKVNIIKDYSKIYFDDGSLCGDEALLCAQNTEGCLVLTSSDRIKAAEFAAKNFGAQVVILDDGFSNRKIKKDFSVLVVDLKKQFGNTHLLPLGPLREPVSEAKRANYIIISNKNNTDTKEAKKEISKKLKTDKITLCNFIEGGYYNIKNNLEMYFSDKKDAIAFCAIGQPEQFYNYLQNSFNILYTKTFCDHYSYTKKDIENLVNKAREYKCGIIATTQKDEVKIKPYLKEENSLNFVTMRLAVQFEDKGLFYAIERELEK